MTKLTLRKGKAMACLVLLFLFLTQSCRKDRFYPIPPVEEHENQLIAESTLNQSIENNPAFKLFTLDWNKARQGTLKGKHVVRIPVINNNNITGLINNGAFDTHGQSLRPESKSNYVRKPGSNINYNNQTPPEVFFIQDNNGGKLHSYLLNFVPENNKANNNGSRKGKLYEWNLTGDTIFVRNIENNIITDVYCLKFGNDPSLDNLATTLKNNKLQSLRGLNDKKVSNFWTWAATLIDDVIGWIGHLFGLSEHYNTGGWRLAVQWSSIFGGGSSGGGSSSGGSGQTGYLSSGWPIYNAYIPGVYYEDGSRNIVTDGGGTVGDPNATSLEGSFEPYPTTHGPNVNLNTLTADYVITKLGIGTYEQQAFLRNPANVEITAALADYLDRQNTITQPDIEFGQWAVGYLVENPETLCKELIDNNTLTVNLPNLDISELNSYPKFKAFS
ncbi:hypothetical protein OQX63_06085 [Pedobacter sp. PF22-3]|uniref:hypothetical protein n=1 Tax=Pedobacter sp. PF22-3 TaxID=2994467 RepID=UPI0022456B7B|nr:hypothetical protein [Pedobacter sp. PF22-3]MCX2493032.1 hypothetical protein [Pedobacter sp. PF22-3]